MGSVTTRRRSAGRGTRIQRDLAVFDLTGDYLDGRAVDMDGLPVPKDVQSVASLHLRCVTGFQREVAIVVGARMAQPLVPRFTQVHGDGHAFHGRSRCVDNVSIERPATLPALRRNGG